MGNNSSKEANGSNGTKPVDESSVQDLPAILHTEPIQSLCVAGDGELFSGGVDKDVILYSWSRHTKRARFKGPTKDITEVIYSNKRGVVYAASRDRSIYAWDWPKEKPETESEEGFEKESVCNQLISEPSVTLQGHTLGVTALAYSEDHPQLLCSGSRDNSVSLWCTSTGKSISSMYSPRNLVTGLEWIEGEKSVLQSSEDKTLRVWDLRSCSTVQHFRARNELQTCCAVSASRQEFVAGSSGSGQSGAGLTLWDRRNERKPIREFKGHSENVKDCMFIKIDDRELLTSCGSDSTVRLWDVGSGDCLHSEYLTDSGPLTSLVSPSNGLIACSSFKDGVSIWTINSHLVGSDDNSISLSIRSKY